MYKKLIYLVPFALALGLISSASAELVAYWTFDEGSGNIVYDSSGNGNDGTINGAEWGDGYYGKALHFNGQDNYVEVPTSDSLEIDTTVTIAAWINWIDAGDAWQGILSKGTMDGPGENYALFINRDGRYFHFVLALDVGRVQQNSPNNSVVPNEWLHVCCTWDGSVTRIYINGEMAMEMAQVANIIPSTLPLRIGHRDGSSHYWNGIIDEVRIYDHALTEAEILAAMEGGKGYPYALGPVPEDGALHSDTWVSLSWRAGDFAVSHDVYLGENFDDVNDGTGDTFRGNQSDTYFVVGFPGFPYPDGLVPGTTYYWRIDEVNDLDPNSPWKGNVWSFMVPPKTAYNPNPADGAKFIDPDVELNWTAGFRAKLHTVYFGDNFDDVNNATVGLPQATTTYTPSPLELDKNYYWRVDEFDGSATHKGDVWSFKTLPDIPITDPNLIGWWKLDEGYGTTAVDWSGHGHHGTLINGPQWEAGYYGGALAFDGRNDYVSVLLDVSETEYAALLWFKTTNGNCGLMAVVDSDLGVGGHDRHIYLTGGNIKIRLWDTEEIETAGLNLANGLWHHVVYTYGATIGGQKVYVDGLLRASGTKNASDFDWQRRVNIGFSNDAANNYFEGVLDDVRIYNKILTQAEVQQTMRGDPLLAWSPNPTNGSTPYIRDATPLSWSPGDMASQHDVYFGTDRGDVADADASDTTGIYRGRQGATSYNPPEGVEWGGGPYYWRIDEFNTDGTISTGSVWTFTVADYITVDDFEAYNDLEPPDPESNRIFLTWIDGYDTPTNGSQVGYLDPPFCEQSIVHIGRQSMPLFYDNSGPAYYSEATLPLTYPRDWTEEGVGVLTLWLYGDPANVAESMYVAVANATGPAAVVYHDNLDAVLIDDWTQWNIDLEEISNQGVVLTNVDSIAIGFGNRNNPQVGGTGMVFIDDVRLYRPPPEPEAE